MSEDVTVVLPSRPVRTYRIAMVAACPYPAPQGSQVLLRQTAEGLRQRGHDVHLVVYGYGAGEWREEAWVHRCARIPGARRTAPGPSLMKPVLDWALVRELKRVIREHDIEIVHAHNYEGLIAALAAGKRPIVYHAHNAMADELPHFLPMTGFAGKLLDRRYPRRADAVIAPHQRLAEYLAGQGCDAARIAVIPPPADLATFGCLPAITGAELVMPPVLYTGNLDRYQNLDLLARAMARLHETAPNARLLVATASRGKGIPGAETVPVHGAETLREVLAQDVVVACPRVSWSGYPIKLLNTMAAGRAVVACQSAAHPISHRHDGVIVPDNDVDAFAEALHWLIRDGSVRARIGKNARATAAFNHDPIRISVAIEEVYHRVSGTV